VDQPQRERIRDDLKGLVKGDLLFDDLSRTLYSTDASIFQVEPLGVVAPRDEDDVCALLRYAGENRIPLIARGAGSGVAGESLGTGLVIDLSQHFRAILDVGADTVRVQPGVVHRDLNVRLAREGRRFAPDPASGAQCTVGGMLATNASGSRALRHGYTRDHVASLRAVLDSGDAVTAARHPRWPAPTTRPGRLEDVVSSVATLLEQHADVVRDCRPRTPFNRCGYLLHDVLSDGELDLARLLVGSEGTLALFTEATLRTVPLAGGRSLVLLAFPRLDAALKASQLALPTGPAACELIDRRLLILVRGGDAEAAALVPLAAEAVLLIEYEADTPAAAHAAAADLADRLHRTERLALQAQVAASDADVARFWRLRESVLPSLYGLRGGAQPVAYVEDVGVPPESLPNYLHRVQEILQRHETTASFLIHALTGQVHTRPFLDLSRPDSAARLRAIAEEVYALTFDLGGTVSAQHGTGIARTPWVARQYGPLYPIFRELKAIFDPRHVLNPGKIVGPDPSLPAWPLRTGGGTSERAREGEKETEEPQDASSAALPVSFSPQFRWALADIRSESANCNGCGNCRTAEASLRMCPIFRATHEEAATPRAKANLMRRLVGDGADPQAVSSDEVRAVADLCVNCKMCALECPAHVDVPRLMLEAKAANVARHGMHRHDWVLARTELFARVGSAVAPLVNLGLRNPTARWLLEKLFGVSRRRRLPAFARRSFLRRAEHRGWTRKPHPSRPRVAYFVDVFANYNDPLIAESVVAVLQHNGIEVYVPPGQRGCGMAPLAYGDVEAAREAARRNMHVLADLAREEMPILCSEPTAALMLRHDALDLLDDPDARVVADRTVEFTAFLWELYQRGRLRTDFRALELALGHHVPCHLKALGRPPAGPSLLALIPGLRVHTIDVGCSGMAGTYGLKAENYDVSLEAGRPMLEELRRPRVLHGSTECSTCRMQMEDGGGKRTLHPAQYLALAYGLVPDVGRRLHEPIRELVLR
jgi:FAD/FMN-containing dehydrogenase/Fe-S oxidoreductase